MPGRTGEMRIVVDVQCKEQAEFEAFDKNVYNKTTWKLDEVRDIKKKFLFKQY